LNEEIRGKVIEQVMKDGTCQNIDIIPDKIKNIFVVSQDITAEEHVRLQAVLQTFVDNSLSKTINFPESATTDDVATAYIKAWELGCKGITVYVTAPVKKWFSKPMPLPAAKREKKPPRNPQIRSRSGRRPRNPGQERWWAGPIRLKLRLVKPL